MSATGDSARAKHVLVISPAGQVYDHDRVKWYDRPRERVVSEYFNIGDMVVYDSTLKMLDYELAEGMEIINTSEYDLERYAYADYAIVRASNFIHNEMKWFRAVEILEKTKLPVFALGVGGQAASREDYKLAGDNLRFWKLVSERSNLIGVRGTFTAELLYSNGIKNVEIVGCPSIFRTRNRDLRIVTPDAIDNVAFSIRREVDGRYAQNPSEYLAIQREFLLKTARSFNTTVTIHGETEEKAFFYKDLAAIGAARETLISEGWFTESSIEEMERLYQEKLFFFLAVDEYDTFIKKQSFAIGYRVHGVLPALANGVPGLLVKYDSRSTELADTLGIPSVILKKDEPADVERLLREVSFEEFNKLYPFRYDKMRFIMEANGLGHRM